jgi:hypothetical protein
VLADKESIATRITSAPHSPLRSSLSDRRAMMRSPLVEPSGLASPSLARPAAVSLRRPYTRFPPLGSVQAGSASGLVGRGGARRFPVSFATGGGAGENLCGLSRCCLKSPRLILSAVRAIVVGMTIKYGLHRFQNCVNVAISDALWNTPYLR